tara:strand:+ start:22224 stop:23120 length:897 start_codon:yes stop_codon:yes gene_type:complete
MKSFYSNGKVLLTGEYSVLNGSLAIGLPTKMGQDMLVENILNEKISWLSFNMNSEKWFECLFDLKSLNVLGTSDKNISLRLKKILESSRDLNSKFLKTGKKIITNLDFDYKWGLGTSSTLINNISKWAEINPYELLKKTFGGSGYDLACAEANSPILFSLNSGKEKVIPVNFNPILKKNLFFIYQNKKQNTKKSLEEYQNQNLFDKSTINRISKISQDLMSTSNINEFRKLIDYHENIMSSVLKIDSINKKFRDYEGSIKSLGAWGGDFFLAVGPEDSLDYFKKRNYKIGYKYADFIL